MRQFLASRLGIQGKLMACFGLMLALALATTSLMFVAQSRSNLTDSLSEQLRQLSTTLALACRTPLEEGRAIELGRMGQDLIKNRNMLFVAFLDEQGRPVAVASRDPHVEDASFTLSQGATRGLMKVREANSEAFGDYLDVVAPVVVEVISSTGPAGASSKSTHLAGYVSVGMSPAREQAQILRVNIVAALIGGMSAVVGVPIAFLLVHRIFLPIRQFVRATDRIASGDLDTLVAIERSDVIGQLARSFNAMVRKVKRHQEDLAAANNALEFANDELEAKVEQRTAQLETANKRLSSEIAEKEDFLRAVSHDLNAPLRNISGMATMLLMKHRNQFDNDIIHRLERIQKNVEVETDLIAEMLELSRIKSRRHNLELVDIGALVNEVGGLFESDFQQKNIQFVIDTPLPVLHCERARLRQVFQNLIDNAIKYTCDPAGGAIHVGCTVNRNEAEFYVRDGGIGIEASDLDKVFFVFRRGGNVANLNIPGKGVGLASVKSIIETYSGSIWVESIVGVGSTFRFTINGKFVPEAGRYTDGERLVRLETDSVSA